MSFLSSYNQNLIYSPKASQEEFHQLFTYLFSYLLIFNIIFPSSLKVFNSYSRYFVIKYQTLKLKGLFSTSYSGSNNFKTRLKNGLLCLTYFVDFPSPSKTVGMMRIKP